MRLHAGTSVRRCGFNRGNGDATEQQERRLAYGEKHMAELVGDTENAGAGNIHLPDGKSERREITADSGEYGQPTYG